MNDNDDKLRRLLATWKDIEPRPDFAADVLRRIRRIEPAHPALVWLTTSPAWTYIAALAAGLLVGTYAAWAPVSGRSDGTLLHSGTVAGNYLSLLAGGAR